MIEIITVFTTCLGRISNSSFGSPHLPESPITKALTKIKIAMEQTIAKLGSTTLQFPAAARQPLYRVVLKTYRRTNSRIA